MRWGPFAALSSSWRIVALVLLIGGTGYALYKNVGLARFMANPTVQEGTTIPKWKFHVNHTCASAYLAAVKMLQADPTAFPYVRNDAFKKIVNTTPLKPDPPPHNPPPFLLLPRLLSTGVAGDFLAFRWRWYLFELFICCVVFIGIAWHDRRVHPFMLALVPFFVASNPWIENLQWGNFQIGTVALFTGAMWCLANGRDRLGGALLGLAIAAHIHPGIAGIPLLLQRRWRPALWAAGSGGVALLLSIAVDGWAINREYFFHYVPHLLSSDVDLTPDMNSWQVLVHYSIWGLVRKVTMLGVPIAYEWAHRATQLSGLAVIGVAVWIGLRGRRTPHQEFLAGVGLLTLSTVQNPHFWPYGLILPAFVGFALWADSMARGRVVPIVASAAMFFWVGLKTQFWTDQPATPPPSWMIVACCGMTLILIALGVWAILAPPLAPPSESPRERAA